ncbi:hypothetical protein BS78_05G246900 [Paspalum vaginatum]|nr:hypothetical protein BS78_05G246900 [Paspalum vaginatum]
MSSTVLRSILLRLELRMYSLSHRQHNTYPLPSYVDQEAEQTARVGVCLRLHPLPIRVRLPEISSDMVSSVTWGSDDRGLASLPPLWQVRGGPRRRGRVRRRRQRLRLRRSGKLRSAREPRIRYAARYSDDSAAHLHLDVPPYGCQMHSKWNYAALPFSWTKFVCWPPLQYQW